MCVLLVFVGVGVGVGGVWGGCPSLSVSSLFARMPLPVLSLGSLTCHALPRAAARSAFRAQVVADAVSHRQPPTVPPSPHPNPVLAAGLSTSVGSSTFTVTDDSNVGAERPVGSTHQPTAPVPKDAARPPQLQTGAGEESRMPHQVLQGDVEAQAARLNVSATPPPRLWSTPAAAATKGGSLLDDVELVVSNVMQVPCHVIRRSSPRCHRTAAPHSHPHVPRLP